MSWIQAIPPAGAPESLRALYDRVRARSSRGEVAALWQTCGLDPVALTAVFELTRTLMDDPAPLAPAQVEMIALVVSATNGCGYCVAHHGPRLARALGDEALARAVALDYREANLIARDRVLLDYAVALSCEPAERKREDVERMREYGFDERAILRATAITGLYNLVNRLASGLGVEVEAGLEPWAFGEQR